MKKHVSLLLVLVLFAPMALLGQKEFKSKERDEYYKRSDSDEEYVGYIPTSKEVVLGYKNEFFFFKEIKEYAPFYDKSLYYALDGENLYNAIDLQNCRGKIDESQILKHGKNGNIEAFIYLSNVFEDNMYSDPGIWVAYSEDSGETWSYYFTGMLQKQPLFVKWYSSYPLITYNGDLQIEACLVRQMSEFIPLAMPSYELVKDGLLLTMPIKTLRKDSDGDGLTDIMEFKFRTDPNNTDTDGDGVPDNLDLNPRFAPNKTEQTIVFEAIVNHDRRICASYEKNCTDVFPFYETQEEKYAVDSTETIMIVTDDPSLQSIQPTSTRMIIVSRKEYQESDRYVKDDMKTMIISPLFKVDGKKNVYIFSKYYDLCDNDYLITKTKKGWRIEVVNSYLDGEYIEDW